MASSTQEFVKLTYRGKYGELAGQPVCFSYNGRNYPMGATLDDPDTCLHPGDDMLIDKDIAIHLFGDVWDPKFGGAAKQDIIRRYGDYKYAEQNIGRSAALLKVGYADIPDVILEIVDERNRPSGNPIQIIAIYCSEDIKGVPPAIPKKALAQNRTEKKSFVEARTFTPPDDEIDDTDEADLAEIEAAKARIKARGTQTGTDSDAAKKRLSEKAAKIKAGADDE